MLKMRMYCVRVLENKKGKYKVSRFKGKEILVVRRDIQRSF